MRHRTDDPAIINQQHTEYWLRGERRRTGGGPLRGGRWLTDRQYLALASADDGIQRVGPDAPALLAIPTMSPLRRLAAIRAVKVHNAGRCGDDCPIDDGLLLVWLRRGSVLYATRRPGKIRRKKLPPRRRSGRRPLNAGRAIKQRITNQEEAGWVARRRAKRRSSGALWPIMSAPSAP